MVYLEERDLKQTLDCIKTMKGYGVYSGHKIGVIRKRVSGMVLNYKPGTIVIYREEDKKYVTIETAMTQEEIKREKSRGSLITTVGTMVGVPKGLVKKLGI